MIKLRTKMTAILLSVLMAFSAVHLVWAQEPELTELDLSSRDTWEDTLSWNIVDFSDEKMTVTAHSTGAGAFHTVNKELTNYHAAFRFTLEQGYASFRITLKNSDTSKINGAAFLEDSSNGYYLIAYPEYFDLYKGANGTNQFMARANINLAEKAHNLDITVFNETATSVRIKVLVDNAEAINVLDDGNTGGPAFTEPGYMGLGGNQVGYVIEKLSETEPSDPPAATELDWTSQSTWNDSLGWSKVQYDDDKMTVTAQNGYNVFHSANQSLTNYHSVFYLTVADGTEIPRMIFKRTDTDNIANGSYFDDNTNGYWIQPENGGEVFNLYKGTEGGPVFLGQAAVNLREKTHKMEITVSNETETSVRIKILVDDTEVINVLDDGTNGGAAYTEPGYVSIGGYNCGFVIAKTASSEPIEPPAPELDEIDFTISSTWKNTVDWNIVDYTQDSMIVTAHETGYGAFHSTRNDLVNYHTAFNLKLDEGTNPPTFRLKYTDASKIPGGGYIDGGNVNGYFLIIYDTNFSLFKGTASGGLSLATGNINLHDGSHNFDISLYNETDSSVRIKIMVDGELVINVLDDGSDGTPAFTEPGYVCMYGYKSGYTLSTPRANDEPADLAVYNFELVDNWTKWVYSDAEMVSGNIVLPNKGGWNNLLGASDDMGNYRAAFKMKLESDQPADSLINLTLRSKEAKDYLLNDRSNNAYHVIIGSQNIQLKRGYNTIYQVSDPISLYDGQFHKYQAVIFDKEDGSVVIRLYVDNKIMIDYTQTGDETTDCMGNPVPAELQNTLTGTGNIQLNALTTTVTIGDGSTVNPNRLKVLVVGNGISYLPAGSEEGWNNSWGAAASSEANDYVHQLLEKIHALDGMGDAEIRIASSIEWEETYNSYALTKLANDRNYGADIILMQVGDAVEPALISRYNFEAYYTQLIQYLNPDNTAKVVLMSTFAPADEINQQIKNVSRKYNYGYVAINHLYDDEANKPQYGDGEGQVSNYDLLEFPNDRGMAKIADLVYAPIVDLIAGGSGLTNAWRYDKATGVDVLLTNGVFPDDAVLQVQRISEGERYDVIKGKLPEHYIADILDIQVSKTIDSPQYSVTIPRPKFTIYQQLELYWADENGNLTPVEANVDDSPIYFNTSRLGTFVFAYPIDVESIYSDGVIDEFEIESVLKDCGDVIIFTAPGLEYLELTPYTFGAIKNTQKPLRFVFEEGQLDITAKVFAALAKPLKTLAFTATSADDTAKSRIVDLAVERNLKLSSEAFFEAGVMREGVYTSLSLPVDLKLSKGGVSKTNETKLLCIEEDDYITANAFTYHDDTIEAAVKNFGLFTLAEVSNEDVLNPSNPNGSDVNTGENTVPYVIAIILMTASLVSVLITYKRKKEMK